MKIYVTHSSGFDYKNELYIPIRESEFNSKHEIILPHENSEKPFSSKEFIKECDLVLAEISYPSTGQGIELGWADAVGVEIICIYKKGAKYSSSLSTVSDKFIEYSSPADIAVLLEQIIQ